MKDIGLYVTLFAIGYSTTMLFGVLTGISANAYVIDAIIGLSVVYKALDNLGAFRRWFGVQPNTKWATLIFGFFHGFGLATKILEFENSPDGLLTRSEEHTSELQSLMHISSSCICLKKKNNYNAHY